MREIPDFQWCTDKSTASSVAIRCPYATVESCPRYYQSLSLLGKAGSTKIPKDEDDRLLANWKRSDLWPRTAEYEISLSGPGESPRHFSNFCPEVVFDRFGYFATDLARYADEIDMSVAHKRLEKENALPNDPYWSWASIKAQHYTECPIYSVLAHRTKSIEHVPVQAELPWWRKHLVELFIGLAVTVIGGLLLKFLGIA